MQFAEIIEHWTGWCPMKQRMQIASKNDFLGEEISMNNQIRIKSRTKAIAAVALVFVAALVGMRLEFDSMQSLDWFMNDPKALEGYRWLANSSEDYATVIAWWDYADGIEEISHRKVVINEASKSIEKTIAGYADSAKPWHKIEYALWYPFESDERVKDVADFFLSENATSAKEIAGKYKATYTLVMAEDLGKYFPVILASGADINDYIKIPANRSSGGFNLSASLKKENIFTRMVNGDNIEGFSKEFDNGAMRIYKLT